MIEILGLELQNVVYFKSAKVRLDKNNLTFIRGLNSDGDPSNPTGNGSGKSLFFSTIPNLFFFAPPLSIRKKSSKELLGASSAVKILMRTASGVKHVITQKSNSFDILEDGVDLKLRTKPLAEKYIKSIFPLSEVEFYTHCFVSTQRPFVMQTDSNLARLEHLSDIFKLDDFDQMRQVFMKKLSSIKDSGVKLQVLAQSENALNSKISRVSTKMESGSLILSKSECVVVDAELNLLIKKEFSILKVIQSAETLRSIEEKLDELRSEYSSKEHPSVRLKWLKAQRASVSAHVSYVELMRAYKSSVKTTQKNINSLELPELSSTECVERLTFLDKASSLLEERLKKLSYSEHAHKQRNAALKVLEKRALAEYSVDIKQGHEFGEDSDFSESIAGLRTSLRLSTLLHKHDFDGTCPTCLSTVDMDNIRFVVSAAEKELPALLRAQAIVSICEEWDTIMVEHERTGYDSERHSALKAKHLALEEDTAEVNVHINIWKKHKYLLRFLDLIEKPEPPEQEVQTDLTIADLEAQVELCSNIVNHLDSKSSIYESNPELKDCRTAAEVRILLKGLAADSALTEKQISRLKSKKAELSTIIEQQTAFHSEFKLYSKELLGVKKQMDELSPLLADKPVLEVLVKAYSSKGLKTLRANEICRILETNLNYYRGLIFAEPFHFSLEASDTGLSIIVDRGNGKISDVRSLSGAESNCFRLLFILSLLPLIPNDRRVNMLILDEPTAHMHQVTRQIFVERYLPAISELVPNIYVITPNSDEYVKGACEWIVSKKGGESKLLTG